MKEIQVFDFGYIHDLEMIVEKNFYKPTNSNMAICERVSDSQNLDIHLRYYNKHCF